MRYKGRRLVRVCNLLRRRAAPGVIEKVVADVEVLSGNRGTGSYLALEHSPRRYRGPKHNAGSARGTEVDDEEVPDGSARERAVGDVAPVPRSGREDDLKYAALQARIKRVHLHGIDDDLPEGCVLGQVRTGQ